MKTYKVILIVLFFFSGLLQAQSLIMGYRETSRIPLIGGINDNSGIYYDIFSKAAKKLNMDLKVVRLPKKRILQLLKSGDIDFYPGFTFTKNRAQYVYYIKNGISTGADIGLSLNTFPLIQNLNQLKGKKVVTAFGGPMKEILSTVEGIDLYSVPRLSLEKAVNLIQKKRYDFYIYNARSIQYYLKNNNIKNMKIHPDCCGGNKPMYFAFSKKSEYYQEEENLNYNELEDLSVHNYPTQVTQDSVVHKLSVIIQLMKESGEIQTIFDKYYK